MGGVIMQTIIATVFDHQLVPVVIDIFGTVNLPVTTFNPVVRVFAQGKRPCHLVDLAQLTPDQHERLVAHMCRVNNRPAHEMKAHLAQFGFALLASQCAVTLRDRVPKTQEAS
jgi:hypothetical protein